MPDSHLGLFKEWRTADWRLHALEQAMSKATLAALAGNGEPPCLEEAQLAKELRQTARDLFELAMHELETRAAANRAP